MAAQSTLQLACSTEGHIVRIVGRGTMSESPAFCETVRQCMRQSETGRVVVDLQQCEYLDSTFLGSFIELHHSYGSCSPPRFLLAADGPARERLLAMTLLDRFFHFSEEVPRPESEFLPIEPHQLSSHKMGLHIMQTHQRLADIGGAQAERFQSIARRLAKELGQ